MAASNTWLNSCLLLLKKTIFTNQPGSEYIHNLITWIEDHSREDIRPTPIRSNINEIFDSIYSNVFSLSALNKSSRRGALGGEFGFRVQQLNAKNGHTYSNKSALQKQTSTSITIQGEPSDEYYYLQWGLKDSTYGSKAEAAWDSGITGSLANVIGVIDTGIDYKHPDLYLNIWLNPGEMPDGLIDINNDGLITFFDLNDSVNSSFAWDYDKEGEYGYGYVDAGDLLQNDIWIDGIDNENNGYIDDLIGWDFYNNDNDPFDDDGHGTHVAGTIGALSNNQTGVAGVNSDIQLTALKFLSPTGGYTFDAIRAIDYFTDAAIRYDSLITNNGNARYLATNNSWGGSASYELSLASAIQSGADQGIIFVTAAGNDGVNNDIYPSYPTNYKAVFANIDHVIAVASINENGRPSNFSNYGPEINVDIAAPGGTIASTAPNDQYWYMSGTSMAAPHVSGALGLLASKDPKASSSELIQALYTGADQNINLQGTSVDGKLLNIASSIDELNGIGPTPAAILSISADMPNEQEEGDQGTITDFLFTVTRDGDDLSNESSVEWSISHGSTSPEDFITTGGSLFFASNEISKTITVQVNGDTEMETDETFSVILSSPTNANIGTNSASAIIINDDTAPPPSLSISADIPNEQEEGDQGTITDFLFTVTRDGDDLSNESSVEWSISHGSTSPEDFITTGGSLFFASNEISKTITVQVNGDTEMETDETFSVILSSPTNANIGTNSASAIIINDDTAPPPSLSISADIPNEQEEGDQGTITDFLFTVTRDGDDLSNESSVEWSISHGSTSPEDFITTGGSLFFASNEISKTITVQVNGDTEMETDETFSVILSSPTNANIGTNSASAIIINDDTAPPPSLSISADIPNEQEEGDQGTITDFLFTVTRDGDDLSNESSVEWSISHGSTSPEDFITTGGSLFFASNEISKTITVQVNGDTEMETDETFSVILSSPTNANIGTNSASAIIINDDTAPIPNEQILFTENFETEDSFNNWLQDSQNDWRRRSTRSIDDWAAEVDGRATNATLELRNPLDITSFNDVRIDIKWLIETSFDSGEFLAIDASINDGAWEEIDRLSGARGTGGDEQSGNPFQDGSFFLGDLIADYSDTSERNLKIRLRATASSSREDAYFDEVVITGLNQTSTTPLPIVSISADDPNQKEEGDQGTITDFLFTVTRDGDDLSNESSVEWSISHGSTSPEDFITTGGSLFFASNEISKTITVQVNGDTEMETDETFSVILSSPTNANIGTNSASAIIINDDTAPPPSLSISADIPNEQEEGDQGTITDFLFTVTRDGDDLSNESSVEWSISHGSTSPEDFITTGGSLFFASNEISKTITVQVNGDTEMETDETFSVILSSPTNANIGTNSASAIIINDDTAPIPNEQILFTENFETEDSFNNWLQDSQNDWRRRSTRSIDDWAAEVDGRATNATLELRNPLDITSFNDVRIDIKWLIETSFDSGEFLAIDASINDGAWEEIDRLSGARGTGGDEQSGNPFQDGSFFLGDLIADYSDTSERNLKIRLRATASSSREDAYFDEVVMTGLTHSDSTNFSPNKNQNESYFLESLELPPDPIA